MPSQYYKDSINNVDHEYDATGLKWSKTATDAGTATVMLYYGPFIYVGGDLSKVLTTEGYIDTQATNRYHYYLKDHLGNTRMTINYSGTTVDDVQTVEYYPFGSIFSENGMDKNLYLYNGKELNNEFFENYDYGARFYDAVLGRWHTIDPQAEKYNSLSSYHYAGNNPILNIDINGEAFIQAYSDGKIDETGSGGTDFNGTEGVNKVMSANKLSSVRVNNDTFTAQSTNPPITQKADPNLEGGKQVTNKRCMIVYCGGEEYHFMENGILHWQDNTIANYEYYMKNRGEFINEETGKLATFDEVFKSQREIYNDIGSLILMDLATVGTRGDFDSGDVGDYFINKVWRSPYYKLFPSYIPPQTSPIKLMEGWHGSPEDLRYNPLGN